MKCTRMARIGVISITTCCLMFACFNSFRSTPSTANVRVALPVLTSTTSVMKTTTHPKTSTVTPTGYVFLHIGKSGGTTVDAALSSAGLSYIGHRHFDWSWIALHYPHHRVLIVLRHPISRAISQFYFSRKLSWTKGMSIRHQSLRDYFNDYHEMLATRGVWQDGEAGASWIAGTHIGNWVAKDQSLSIDAREKYEKDSRAMCTRVEHRLRHAYWIGFTETLETDIGRLSFLLGRYIHIGKHNVNQHPNDIEPDVVLKITALTTLDHWLYDNAKKLVSDPTHTFSPCPIYHPCRSTRYTLNCSENSPFGRVSYTFKP